MFNLATISLLFMLVFNHPKGLPAPELTGNFKEDVHCLAEDFCRSIYCECGLDGKLDYEIYLRAFKGISELSAPRKDILTIIDYAKPSSERRMYVIDLVNRKLLYQTLVAHGRNSGEKECNRFSNRPQSHQSSPGFYLTGETYSGNQGYSLRLDGLEPGINDNARARDIVVHGADYVCQKYVDEFGYIGRSFGCLAVPEGQAKDIIDCIKGGSCIYINTNDPNYLSHTAFRN
jgi:hypothetical protein